MRRAFAGAGTLLVAVLVVYHGGAFSPPVAAATRAGEASIIVPDDGRAGAGQPLNSGSTGTPFSLKLPTAPSCRGDSANDGYRVQTYMVPASVDPATLTFGSVGPLPTATGAAFREPLFATTSDPVVNNQTAAATKPHGPGPVINIPAMNFSVYKPGDVPAGIYNVGVACTKGQPSPTQLDTFWNTQLDVKAGLGAAGDAPLWAVVKPPTPEASGAAPSGGAAATGGKAASGAAAISGPTGGSGGGDTHGTDGPAPASGTVAATPHRPVATHSEAAPSGAPPSFHIPVTGLLPNVRLHGGWAAVIATVAFIVLAAGPLIVLTIRRNNVHGKGAWLRPTQRAFVPQEGR